MFVLYLFFFFSRARKFYISHISRGHSNGRSRCNRMSYFPTCFPFPPPRIPLTWINSQCRLARVEEKGFSCLEENVLRTVTIEMIGKFLPPYPPFLSISSFLSFCFRHSSNELLCRGITLINVAQRIHRHTKFYVRSHQSQKCSSALIAICCELCANFL